MGRPVLAGASASGNADNLGASIAIVVRQSDLLEGAIPFLDHARDKEGRVIARLRVL